MSLNLKNPEVEALVDQITARTGETKTEAVRQALLLRRDRLLLRGGVRGRVERWIGFLEAEVWPRVPADQLGRVWTHEEEDVALGYGDAGL